MKKVLLKILTAALTLCLLVSGLVACGSNDWTKPTLTNWGKVVSENGGFLVETENYLYFINGVATNTDDNTFGVPVKGSLMVQDKKDFSKAPQIVVPKLFASTDYDAGVYIYGDRAYYGTPCTDKDSSGEIANYEMTFQSTKLDGTDTESYFTVNALSVKFRILENDGSVYIVYYDTEDQAVYSYDVDNDKFVEISKTDAQAEGENAVSLAEFKFLDNEAVGDGYAVVYTETIYDEDYYESAAQEEGYERATKDYNVVKAYGIFDGVLKAKTILNGQAESLTYAIKHADGDNVYVSATDVLSNENNFVYDITDGSTDDVVNIDVISSESIILDDGKVLTLSEGKFKLRNALANDNETQKVIAIDDNASQLIGYVKDGKFIYYLNSSNTLCRIEVENEEAIVENVSEDIVSTAWYAPEFIEIGEKDYVFYLDSSNKGCSYVKYVELSQEATTEDTDNDDVMDKAYLEGHNFLAQRIDKDVALYVTSYINDVSNDIKDTGAFEFVENNKGVLSVESLTKANEIFNEYEDVVDLIDQTAIDALNKYNKAVEMANKYNKLKAVKNLAHLSVAERQALQNAYNSVKEDIEEFRDSDSYANVNSLLGDDLRAYYQNCVKEFETEEN